MRSTAGNEKRSNRKINKPGLFPGNPSILIFSDMVSLLIGPTSDGKFQTLVDLVGDARSNPRAFAINGRKIATYKNGGFENLRRFQKISS